MPVDSVPARRQRIARRRIRGACFPWQPGVGLAHRLNGRPPVHRAAVPAPDEGSPKLRQKRSEAEFNLALQQTPAKVNQKPYIPMLQEDNVQTGFFEVDAFLAVLKELPADRQPIAIFAYVTGWRKEEILTLTWRQVDFTAGTVRLEPGTTKNRQGRTIFLTRELHALLEEQWRRTTSLERQQTPTFESRMSEPLTFH